jgi:hypothetical protein
MQLREGDLIAEFTQQKGHTSIHLRSPRYESKRDTDEPSLHVLHRYKDSLPTTNLRQDDPEVLSAIGRLLDIADAVSER